MKYLLLLLPFCLGAVEVDPPVWDAVARGERVSLFFLLSDQPYSEVPREPLQRAMLEARVRDDNDSRDLDAFTLRETRAILDHARPRMAQQQDGLQATLVGLGATRILRYDFVNLMRAEIPAAAVAALADDPRIASIGLVERGEAQINISVRSLGTPAFWNGSPQITGTGQSIAMLDSGVSAHPALQSATTSARFLTQSAITCTNPDDYMSNADFSGHGTHVAGILTSAGTPSFASYLGVAFRLSNLYNIKVGCRTADSLNPTLLVLYSDDDLLLGLQHAVTNTPAKVINISLGKRDRQEDSTFNRAIDAAAETYGLTIVTSAGNYGPLNYTLTSPGTTYNGITVGAFNTQGTEDRADDLPAGFSSRGPTPNGRRKPDIMAPGGLRDNLLSGRPEFPCSDGFPGSCGLYSTSNASSGYVPLPGTSMAAAHISGAVALLRQAGVTNPLAIKALLINTTDTGDWSPISGWGYANLIRLRAEADSYLLAGVSPGRYNLYRATINGALSASLVWNRTVAPNGTASLNDLDLAVYKGADGTRLTSSESKLDNVEKLGFATGNGSFVLKVRNQTAGTGPEQAYALATNVRGFALLAGPALSLICQAPFVAAPGSSVAVLCTARNSGDLEAYNVSGTVTLQNTTLPATFGTIAPGGKVTRSWTLTAPTALAAYTVRIDIASTTMEETFAATASVNFFSSNCTYGISADATSFAADGGAGQITVATQPGCPTTTQSAVPWITVTAGGRFTVAANTGGPRTGTIFASGETVQILQRSPTASSVFDDVPAAVGFGDYINLLRQNNVTSGCSARNYCPDDNTTRGQMAIFIVRSVLGTDDFAFPLDAYFEDVRPTHPQFKYVQKLREQGITSGCTTIEFCADLLINRGQMAVFIVRGKLGIVAGQAFPYRQTPYFNDVPATHPFFPFIQKMRELGITSGCGDNNFCPDGWTTRGQMAVFLIRSFFTP